MDDTDLAELSTPTLMRSARGAYATSIRAELDSIGIENLPRNAVLILAGIDDSGGPRLDPPSDLGITKQAVSQLVDTLVRRGYLTRSPDPQDRRRTILGLTGSGEQVVAAISRGVEAVDVQLRERVSAEQVQAMRSALLALSEIKSAGIASGAARRRRPRQLRSFSPIFPVADLTDALAHYSKLGFDAFADAESGEYGFANREGVSLHLAQDPDHDPTRHCGSAYLYVQDADALYEQWTQPGIGGHTRQVAPTPYLLREGSHVDPDGNLIRFGSPVEP